jgi:hypothetical protein
VRGKLCGVRVSAMRRYHLRLELDEADVEVVSVERALASATALPTPWLRCGAHLSFPSLTRCATSPALGGREGSRGRRSRPGCCWGVRCCSMYRDRCGAAGGGEVGGRPQHAQPGVLSEVGARPAGDALGAVHETCAGDLRGVFDQQVHLIVLAAQLHQVRLEVGAGLREDLPQLLDGAVVEHAAAVLRHEDRVDVHVGYTVSTASFVASVTHGPMV